MKLVTCKLPLNLVSYQDVNKFISAVKLNVPIRGSNWMEMLLGNSRGTAGPEVFAVAVKLQSWKLGV